jgi:hypothetical protein
MRYLYFVIAFILFAGVTSCKKSHSSEVEELSGTYKGTFEHTPYARRRAQVTLSFSGNKYTGSSDQADYADICNGTYFMEGSKITFTDQCVRTANVSSAIILNGEFKLEVNGNNIQMTKGYDNWSQDIFVLEKQ